MLSMEMEEEEGGGGDDRLQRGYKRYRQSAMGEDEGKEELWVTWRRRRRRGWWRQLNKVRVRFFLGIFGEGDE